MVGSELQSLQLGDPLLDEYLAFVGARARRNTWLAVAFDLKVFFSVVGKPPADVRTRDVLDFLTNQRRPRHGSAVVRLADGESGLAARTIARRTSSVRSLFDYLVLRGDTTLRVNPVPHGLAARQPGSRGRRSVPLIRTPRTLPHVVSPPDVDALLGALRTRRDQAMVEAMLFGGLRRCEVLGLRLADVNLGERRLFISEGKGGRQRIVPISSRFFATWVRISTRSDPAPRRRSACSSCSRDAVAAGRCRPMGSTKFWRVPALVLACHT